MAQTTINNQVVTLNVQKHLNLSNEKIKQSSEQVSSGLRVNKSQDDPAALSIAERMNSEIRGMNVGIRHANDGISTSQKAESGLEEVSDKLQRMRALAVRSAEEGNSSADREKLNEEFNALNSEISRIAETTNSNGASVLEDEARSMSYQSGSNHGDEDSLSFNLEGVDPLDASIDTYEASMETIADIDNMIGTVADSRASFGAMQARFESTISNLQDGVGNQSATRGRTMDANFALEAAEFTRSQMKEQAGASLASQANTTSRSVQQLLG